MKRPNNRNPRLLDILPLTAQVTSRGHLSIGGCDAVDLVSRFGSPLYVFDETSLRRQCSEFKGEFGRRYPNSLVIYASKAFTNPMLVSLVDSEGLGLDVVSGGELAVARAVKFPAERIYFHGNNKSRRELEEAVDYRLGRVVLDGMQEAALLNEVASARGVIQDVLVRVNPGVDAHTHSHITTGVVDSKFGILLEQAEDMLKSVACSSNLNLLGLHCHIGSQVFEVEPYLRAVDVMLELAADMHQKTGFELMEFSPGGGFGVQYLMDAPAPPVSVYAEAITSRVAERCGELGLTLPRLVLEPGRAIVGRAGVALYTIGNSKDIPGVRRYISVDGGMGDNIRPALYEAKYEAMVANRTDAPATEKVTISGRYCESGDILVKDAMLPAVETGDIVAIPVSGAYAPPLASNYNSVPRPAMVMVSEGRAKLMRRRETYQDMMARDLGIA